MTMTDEQGFAWMRSHLAPNVRGIEVYDDELTGERVVLLEGAEPQQVERLKNALSLRFFQIKWRVASRENDLTTPEEGTR